VHRAAAALKRQGERNQSMEAGASEQRESGNRRHDRGGADGLLAGAMVTAPRGVAKKRVLPPAGEGGRDSDSRRSHHTVGHPNGLFILYPGAPKWLIIRSPPFQIHKLSFIDPFWSFAISSKMGIYP